MRFRLILLSLTAVLGLPSAFAMDCNEILAELSRTPNEKLEGLVTTRVPLTAETIIMAYSMGLFAYLDPTSGNGQFHSPAKRGVIEFASMSIGRTDKKIIRRMRDSGHFKVTKNQAFEQVMRESAKQARDPYNWITETHIQEFTKLYKLGYGHSYEVWENGELVGGLYGVLIGGYFAGESMFHHRPDVTKLAYAELIDDLQAKGHKFIDVQQLLEGGLAQKWHGREISREEFQAWIAEAAKANRGI